eukprot:236773-Hanusia_phi.AAC.1
MVRRKVGWREAAMAGLAGLAAAMLVSMNLVRRESSLLQTSHDARQPLHKDAGKAVDALRAKERIVKERVKLLTLQVQEEELKKNLILEHRTTKHLQHQALYSQEAQDMYKQAEEYENEAREYYYKAQEAYWQANSQASYEDWKRGQQEWEYWYNRPSISDKASESSLQVQGPNLAKTYLLAAAFTYFDRANKPSMKNWNQLTKTWDSEFAKKAESLRAKGMTEATAKNLFDRARKEYLSALINFVQLHGSFQGWKAAENMWRDGRLNVQQSGSVLKQDDGHGANFANDLDDGKNFVKTYRQAMKMHHGEF